MLASRKWLAGLGLGLAAGASLAATDFATDDERNSMQVFERARPSVVFVTNEQLARDPRSYDIMTVPAGAGTGFVWSNDGYIVTNYHVVEGASKVMITLQDQSSWPAKVVGLAPERDLAVLKITTPNEKLVSLPLGDSKELTVGRKVLAIGNPLPASLARSAGKLFPPINAR
jgi:S1-C subfamily serine protease